MLLGVVAALSAAAPAAEASGSAVTAQFLTADAVSEVSLPVEITGVAHVPSTLTVGWAELHEGCYSPIVADEVLDDLPVSGTFSMQQAGIVREPGPHVLCAFLEDDRNRTVAASVAPFTARAPRSAFFVDAPRVVPLGATVRVRVAGTSEAPRSVYGKLAPPGMGCEAALSSGNVFLSLLSEVTALDRTERVRLDRYGLWHACVHSERYWTTTDVTDTLSQAPIRVTVRCTAASRELSRARDRWRAMSRRLRLRGLPPSPQLRIRGMAVRRARARVEEACAPGT